MPITGKRSPQILLLNLPHLDSVVAGEPVRWAINRLIEALARRGFSAVPHHGSKHDGEPVTTIIIASRQSICHFPEAQGIAAEARPADPESFLICPIASRKGPVTLVYSVDASGLVYALTELSDRVMSEEGDDTGLAVREPLLEGPAARVRGISRIFSCRDLDRPWLVDRSFWESYFAMLSGNRFNKFSLTLGMAYNYPYDNEFVSDVYLHFPYPFLVKVPGHDVRVAHLDESEREENLRALQFMAREAAKHGLQFCLGLWNHQYDFGNPKGLSHAIEGLSEGNHAAYARDALRLLLQACPEISGITFRVHVESGISEANLAFWRTLFEAFGSFGRKITIDLHAKGVSQDMLDMALATGMPVTISPKHVGEHSGLPYHAASIRQEERIRHDNALVKWGVSEGSRRYLRYGYGDLLKGERPYDVVYRVWPGTQRLLLWGDPALAAGFGRTATFGGAAGIEYCEPLSFRGRMPSSSQERPAASRPGYRDAGLAPRHDWEKYEYGYRLLGRLAYAPDGDAQGWRRFLRARFGAAARPCEEALAEASRILPLMTLTHAPSASNNTYWPEIYTNMSIVDEAPSYPYGYDMQRPARYGTVRSFDPQFFMSAEEWAKAVHTGAPLRRYTPVDVALWLERCASAADGGLAAARAAGPPDSADFRRLAIDVAILAGLGHFFAHKNRSSCLWELYTLNGSPAAASLAIDFYGKALAAWRSAVEAAGDAYESDLSFGPSPWMGGHWANRTADIEGDIRLMAKLVKDHPRPMEAELTGAALAALLRGGPQRLAISHEPPAAFSAAQPVDIALAIDQDKGRAVVLHFREVDQTKAWGSAVMDFDGARYTGTIPASATRGGFAIQYYFEISGQEGSTLYPGLAADLSNQPYFAVAPA
ncbi:hypothetical protein [Taklimakanibacter lacteus]|uniref:hypothetical protein n=1 Tax=Taklimakanibacter lacteus TaxID=2268456 RepID=UPI000E660484